MAPVLADITMSLDGFVTAPDDRPGQGLGTDGEILHNWVFGGPWRYDEPHEMRPVGADKVVLDELTSGKGVSVVGRRMYEVAGAWGGRSPFGPCVVVTHRVADQPDPETGFVFVDGFEAAVERAQEMAGDDGVVGLGGGASIIQQGLQAGLVDEVQIHVAPVLLGGGRTLFGDLGTRVRLEPICVIESPHATHVRYRVVR